MRRLTVLAAVAAVFLSLTASFALADDPAKPAEKAVTNKVCPLMGDETNPKWRVEYEGQYVYFCCSGCIDMFKADPAAAIAKLSPEDKAAIQKNTVCPVSGETIEKFDTRADYNGKLVYFCCAGCKATYDKQHPSAKQ